MRKKEIGKIKTLQIIYIENKVIRNDKSAYCEKTEFQVNINNKMNCVLNVYTDGTIELFD